MKITTKVEILAYCTGRGYVSGTELESKAQEWRTKASVISRRARELVNEGKLERTLGFKKTVQYRLPPEPLSNYLNKQETQGALL